MVDEPLDISWELRVRNPEKWHRNYRLSKGLEPLAPIRTCSRCGGRGWLRRQNHATGFNDWNDYHDAPCPQCNLGGKP